MMPKEPPKDPQPRYIVTPEIAQLRQLIDQMRVRRNAGDFEANHLLVTGESGVGKSTFAERYVELNPAYESGPRTIVPVGYHTIRTNSSVACILQELLASIGDPRGGKGGRRRESDLRERLEVLVETVQMEVLILDETQVALQSQTGAARFRRLDLFKDLMSTLGVSMVFFGTPWVRQVFRESSQTFERIAHHRDLSLFRISDSASRLYYFTFLRQLAGIYELELDTQPDTSELGYRIYAFSLGRHRRIVALFEALASESKTQGAKVSEEDCSAVYQRRGDFTVDDPFAGAINELLLTEQAMDARFVFDGDASKPREVSRAFRSFKLVKKNKKLSLLETTRL